MPAQDRHVVAKRLSEQYTGMTIGEATQLLEVVEDDEQLAQRAIDDAVATGSPASTAVGFAWRLLPQGRQR